jgi:hypothetical protein
VDSSPPALRSKIVLSAKSSSVVLHSIDRYCARLPCLEDLTFYAYFKQFDLSPKPKTHMQEVDQDAFGNFVYQRGSSSIVRFTDFHPAHQMEAYFFNVLLQHCPFRSEAMLLSPENISSSYFAECQLRGIINSTKDLKEHLEAYSRRNMIASEQRQQLLNKILQKHPPGVSSFEPMRRAPRPNPTDVLPGLDVLDGFQDQQPTESPDSFSLNREQRCNIRVS